MLNTRLVPLVALAAAVMATGCATKKYTRAQITESEQRMTERADRVDGQIRDIESQVEATQTRVKQNETQITQVSKTAQDALDRAVAAGKLAEGKLLYEKVLANDKVRFGFERTELSDQAKGELDAFAGELKRTNKNIYVEIQGHTDNSGEENFNLRLGEARAEAVRSYLNRAGIPLHRMAVISYGESEPIGDNKTRDGRNENRRVVLVVLQ